MAFLGTFAATGKSTSRPETRNTPMEKLLALLPKVGRPQAKHLLAPERETPSRAGDAKSPYFSGAFFIFAQVRGNWGGVSFILRMMTSRCTTSVPGMA